MFQSIHSIKATSKGIYKIEILKRDDTFHTLISKLNPEDGGSAVVQSIGI
jgi:hypothetical protein